MRINFPLTLLKPATLLALVCILHPPLSICAQGTAFTYQGRLNNSGSPAGGAYDFRFRLSSDSLGNNYVGATLLTNGVPVSNGLFTVTLDFGQNFPGAERWLQIDVRTNGVGSYTSLTPLQSLTASPYAITAGNVTGVVPNGGIGGSYSNPVTFNNGANQFAGAFAGNGSGLSNVNAQTLGGLLPSDFWTLTGNNVAPGQFLGSTNDQPVEIKARGQRALRLEPNTNGAPNVIAGSAVNQVDNGVIGVTISGGGAENYFGNSYPNRAAADFSAIGGGIVNLVQGYGSVIGGGVFNNIQPGYYSVISGGYGNTIQTNAQGALIAGGYNNVIGNGAISASIVGGNFNTNGSSHTVIAGGNNNAIEPFADLSVIGGGWFNLIQGGADQSVVVGGNGDKILSGARESFIGGGFANTIQTNAAFSFLGGGTGNTIGTNSTWGAIMAGENNVVANGATHATIAGGRINRTESSSTTISGGVNNRIHSIATYATIAGGAGNSISNETLYSAIGGGVGNDIQRRADRGFIGGGSGNTLREFSSHGTIAGGAENTTVFNSQFATIGGGRSNVVGSWSFVGGGEANFNSGSWSSIAGGQANTNRGVASVIDGGANNTIGSAAQYATIPGGAGNTAGGRFSLAAGRRAQAVHDGAFVWADSTDADFASTTSNQFNIRAMGGLRLETASGSATLNGQPLVTLGGTSSNFWQLSGNNVAAGQFLGSTNNRAVEFRVNNTRALRLEPNGSGAPNVIGGSPNNFVPGGIVGATISGGGATNFLGDRYTNSVLQHFGTVLGGAANTASGNFSTAGGGSSTASGYGSVAIGSVAIASGDFASVALGYGSIASGRAATALGYFTEASGNSSTALGSQSRAMHQGSFVWADSQLPAFDSTTNDQFSVRATNGVRLETGQLSVSGHVALTDPGKSLQFPATFGANAPMIAMYPDAGNVDRMVIAHSPIYSNWGLQYQDTSDRFNFLRGGLNVMTVDLNLQRVGIRRVATTNPLEVEGEASKSTAGSWLANSDRRIKTDITTVSDALEKLARVRLVQFRYNETYRAVHPCIEDRTYLNVVAQEFATVFPDHVKSSGEKLPDGEEILQVDTYPLTIYSAAAIQELNRKVDKLKTELDHKDAENAELKRRLDALEKIVLSRNSR
jgi:hypothetical protein